MLYGKKNRTALALVVNAVLLLFILLAICARDGRLLPGAAALGQINASVPGSVTVMPGQLSPNTWGCYVVDSQNQTLSVYEYSHGDNKLHLAASRDIQYDRRLGFFNTTPSPLDIKSKVELEENPTRVMPTTNRSPESDPAR